MPPQVTWRVSQRHLETWSEHTFPCTSSCFTKQMALTYSNSPASYDVFASICCCKLFLKSLPAKRDKFAWLIDLGEKMKLRLNHLQEFNRLIIRDYKDWGIYKTCASNISRVAYEYVFARHSRRHLIIISSTRKSCCCKLFLKSLQAKRDKFAWLIDLGEKMKLKLNHLQGFKSTDYQRS